MFAKHSAHAVFYIKKSRVEAVKSGKAIVIRKSSSPSDIGPTENLCSLLCAKTLLVSDGVRSAKSTKYWQEVTYPDKVYLLCFKSL